MRTVRNQIGMSQRTLADKLAARGIVMDASAIARIEGGGRVVRLGEAIAIAHILGFSMDLNQDGRPGDSVAADKFERLAHQILEAAKSLRCDVRS